MLSETYALVIRDLRRWYRTPGQIILVFTTPLMWLLLFGQAFNLGKLAEGGPPGTDLVDIWPWHHDCSAAAADFHLLQGSVPLRLLPVRSKVLPKLPDDDRPP